MDRTRYTVTLSLTYYFETEQGRVADPDMLVRAYLDGCLAEAMNLGGVEGDHHHAEFRRLLRSQQNELDARWKRNSVLNKWLDYLSEQGHLVLD